MVGGNGEVMVKGYRISFWSEEDVLKLITMAAQFYEYAKSHLVVYFKWVNYMVYLFKNTLLEAKKNSNE